MLEMWPLVATSDDEVLAGIAMKAIKETRYHWRHASDWTIRLGDGTAISNQRMQAAVDGFFPYTNEWFALDAIDARALKQSLTAPGLNNDPLEDGSLPIIRTPWRRPNDAQTPEEASLTQIAAVLAQHLHNRWRTQIEALFEQAHLRIPPTSQLQTRGRFGLHGEHLSLLLAEMQSFARAHPGASW
jgi:ring-1,2-phenylacetyl-CoA epoxidase subunit PaaC